MDSQKDQGAWYLGLRKEHSRWDSLIRYELSPNSIDESVAEQMALDRINDGGYIEGTEFFLVWMKKLPPKQKEVKLPDQTLGV